MPLFLFVIAVAMQYESPSTCDRGCSSSRRRSQRLNEALLTLSGCLNQILLERQSHHPNMIRPYFEEVYAWEERSRCRKMGDNQRRGNRAFHHGYLRSLRFTDCRPLNAIFPSAPELHAMREQKVQHPASHLESRLLYNALPREQAQPIRPQPVGKSPYRYSVQINCREQPITG